MCDSVNHTRFPKEDHLPDWVCRDKHGNKGERVEKVSLPATEDQIICDPSLKYVWVTTYLNNVEPSVSWI